MSLPLRAASQTLRHPGRSAVLAGVIALAVGTATAGYAVMDSLLFRPLPFPQPDRLAVMRPSLEIHRRLRTADVKEEKRRADESPLVAAQTYVRVGSLSDEQGPAAGQVELTHYEVSSSFFHVVGAAPLYGRPLNAADAGRRPRSAVLGFQLWTTLFGADAEIVGKTVELKGERLVVAGIMPPAFAFPVGANIWTAVARVPEHPPSFVRLSDGVTVEALAAAFPRLDVYPAADLIRPKASAGLALIFLAAVLVLVIAVVQLCFVIVSTAVSRGAQTWIRKALGASDAVLLREFLAEVLIAAACGVAAAWALIPSAVGLVTRLLPTAVTRGQYIDTDWRAFAFSVVITLAAVSVIAVLTRVLAQRVSLTIHHAGVLGHSDTKRMSRWLMALQLGGTAALLYLCVLSIASLDKLQGVDLGIETDRVLLARLPEPSSPAGSRMRFDEIERTLLSLPGVTAVARGATFPFARGALRGTAALPRAPEFEKLTVRVNYVTPGYFRTLGIPVIEGRHLTDLADTRLAVVNQALARQLAPHGPVIGQMIQVTAFNGTIVGIARDAVDNVPGLPPDPQIYLADAGGMARALFIGTNGEASAVAATARTSLAGLLGVQDISVAPLRRYAAVATAPQRTQAWLLMACAFAGLVLAGWGIVASIGLTVRQQTREIGLRLALGAARSTVGRQTVSHVMAPGLIGVAGGLLAGMITATLVRNVFYGVAPVSFPLGALVAVVVAMAAATAAAIPAAKAASLDPAAALRQ